MPALFADTVSTDGVNVNSENFSLDPAFTDAENNDFTINQDSPAFASGDVELDLAGSSISDNYAASDITFSDPSSAQNTGVQLNALGANVITADGNTISRDGSTLTTFTSVAPSLGAFEVFFDANGNVARSTAADIARSELAPSAAVTGGTQIADTGVAADDGESVTLVFRQDEVNEGTTQDEEQAATGDDNTILVNSNREFTIEFELENSVRIDEEGIVTENGNFVFTDERTNQNNTETKNVTTQVFRERLPSPTLTVISGGEVEISRRATTRQECPKKVPLIGVDYNLNTLICISEQYDRNVINVPYGLGVGWAQGPPALRLRGKTVYRVLNNSPASSYVK